MNIDTGAYKHCFHQALLSASRQELSLKMEAQQCNQNKAVAIGNLPQVGEPVEESEQETYRLRKRVLLSKAKKANTVLLLCQLLFSVSQLYPEFKVLIKTHKDLLKTSLFHVITNTGFIISFFMKLTVMAASADPHPSLSHDATGSGCWGTSHHAFLMQ